MLYCRLRLSMNCRRIMPSRKRQPGRNMAMMSRDLALPQEAKAALKKAPHRTPAQPWPPTDPFIYRFFEIVMLYGPVFKDIAHEMFGDGIMSAIDMGVDIKNVEDPA